MSVKIRLSRHGAKKKPFYRIVVANSAYPRDGRYLEQVGTYDPAPNPAAVKVQRGVLEKWLSRGARPTDTVARMLKKNGFPTRPAAAPASETPAAEA